MPNYQRITRKYPQSQWFCMIVGWVLGNALGTDSRRIRQWLAGERSVPVGVWTDIKILAEQRKRQIDELINKL